MKQVHFQSRTHLILWLETHCPRPAIVRALYEGQVEFFGGFDPIPPTTQPGWIMRITSAHGKTRYVAIIAYRDRYGIRILRDVPWECWIGSTAKNRTVLMNGDHPTEYWELRRIWNEFETIQLNK